jgi:rubredoxin
VEDDPGISGEPMDITAEKIPGGFNVDGLDLRTGKCGCTSILPCCHSWSKVKRNGNTFNFSGKTTTPETKETFTWGYTVRKGDYTVIVTMEDARDKEIFSGYYPPALEAWIEKGWDVIAAEGKREDFGLWRCAACKWLYKESVEGRKFEDLTPDWTCPVCGAGKNAFEQVG